MIARPLPTPETPDIQMEMILNGQVMSFTVRSSSRTTIDKFVQLIKDEEIDWPADRVAYFFFDFSESFAGFNTPYGNQRMRELMEWRPEITAYSAILVPHSFMIQVARVFINRMPHNKSHSKLCFSRQEALMWLQEALAQNK